MKPCPVRPSSGSQLAEFVRWAEAEIRALQPIPTPGTLTGRGPNGTFRAVLENSVPQSSAPIIQASVVREWRDCLDCSTDGGATTFKVMKPEPLRVSRVGEYGTGGTLYMGQDPTIALQTNATVWAKIGFVLEFTWPDTPDNRVGSMTVWPQWVNGENVGSTVNLHREPGASETTRFILCAAVNGVAEIVASTGTEAIGGGGDTTVNFVDVTAGRDWRFIDEITQQLSVDDVSGPIGTVNPS